MKGPITPQSVSGFGLTDYILICDIAVAALFRHSRGFPNLTGFYYRHSAPIRPNGRTILSSAVHAIAKNYVVFS